MTHLLLSNCVMKKVRSFILCEFVKQNKSNNLSPQLEEGNGVGDFKEPLQGTDEGNVSAFQKYFPTFGPCRQEHKTCDILEAERL